MKLRKTKPLLACLFICFNLKAQINSDIKFGKIDPADFSLSADSFDSGANALIIADIASERFEKFGETYIYGGPRYFTIYKRFIRVKIINNKGFDAGNYQILLSSVNRYSEVLVNLKGSTFNLENGIISETKLDQNSIYDQKYNNNLSIRKFSMPALKAGSIYDLEYTIRSPIDIELKPWEFQGKYPRLWSEYEVFTAAPFHYEVNFHGDQHFDLDTIREISETYSRQEFNDFNVREIAASNRYNETSVAGNAIDRRWVKKNVPSLHEEPFVTKLENYNSRLSFQLDYFEWPGTGERENVLPTWNYFSKQFFKAENMGLSINHDNNWIYADLKQIIQNDKNDNEKANHIYTYIRDHFKLTSPYGLQVNTSLKEVFENKVGNVAEINFILITMLRKAGLHADPLILSTRENGLANAGYPIIREYNYVICVFYSGDKDILLDASQPYNSFSRLPISCYNGYGHVLNEEYSVPIYLSADSVYEKKVTNVLILNDDKGKQFGSFKKIFGNTESDHVRTEIMGSSENAYEKKIRDLNSSAVQMENIGFDSLKNFDSPVILHFDFEMKDFSSADIVYFNPLFEQGYKSNPFKSISRSYPVEMPGQEDETYMLNMDIPAGYQVEELPKSARILYNENEGFFEYIMEKGENCIRLRTRLRLTKTFFPVEEYSTLRAFFANIVKKESEQIVFKKIK
jgi:hypothetical protein